MEAATQIHSILATHLPFYQAISNYTQNKYSSTLNSLNTIYTSS